MQTSIQDVSGVRALPDRRCSHGKVRGAAQANCDSPAKQYTYAMVSLANDRDAPERDKASS